MQTQVVLKVSRPEILDEMAKSGDLTDALAQRLREVVANFKAGFKG